ncbi:unnamed protein product [Durusdinium trenchii]|uniref:Uncharacterized protein n=1 Tax=Durusdinium trenchii TaxID=1381693 RepID=A0ABP0I2L2_9DINO
MPQQMPRLNMFVSMQEFKVHVPMGEQLPHNLTTTTAQERPAQVVGVPGEAEFEKGSSDSSESKEKEKKKRTKKKKKKKSFKVTGKKDYGSLFAGTGLDKDAKTRKKVSRLARRALKKKSKGFSSTDSGESTGELGAAAGARRRADGRLLN